MSGAILRRRDRTARSLRVVHYSSAVNISLETRRATALPADFRDAMEPYLLES